MKNTRQKQIMENLTLIFSMIFRELLSLWGKFSEWHRTFKTLSKLPNEGCFENLGWYQKQFFMLNLTQIALFPISSSFGTFFSTKILIKSTAKTKLNSFQNPTLIYFPLKFSFSEKATKICTIFLMVLTFTKPMSKPWGRVSKFLWSPQKSWTLQPTLFLRFLHDETFLPAV